MRPQRLILILVLSALCLSLLPAAALRAQEAEEGRNYGNYNVHQSIEIGGRLTDNGLSTAGNQDVYNTFVNLHQGVRLFDQTLEMRSLDHKGLLFDNLFMSSFGYGGDPNNFSTLRVSKIKWYEFTGTFRRDRNVWNYNLLANPLNPSNSNPAVPLTYSPHLMQLTRKMTDLGITLLPTSRVRFRLGYTRNINQGPSLSTIHEGTDTQTFQDWKTTVNAYQLGVDFRVLPRTNISYDQFLQYYKGDTSWADQDFQYVLANGTPADLGIVYNTAANSPCAAPIANFTTTPPTAKPTCNGYTSYYRSAPVRTSAPVEQLSIQSQWIKNLDIAGRVMYTASDSDVRAFRESFGGYLTRTNQVQFGIAGPAFARRVSSSVDFAATYSFTPKFRLVDEFRFYAFRIPGQFAPAEVSLFGTSMLSTPNLSSHVNGSPADALANVSSLFFSQDIKLNTVQLEYDFTKRLGGRLGYRYRHRTIAQTDLELADEIYLPNRANRGDCALQNGELPPDCVAIGNGAFEANTAESDSENTAINEHSLLAGVWARPVNALRITGDFELMSADRAFTRISPRQLQHYKVRANYKANGWINFGGFFNIYEARNNVTTIDHLEHSRSYGLNATVSPSERWSLDTGIDHNNVFSQTNICFSTVLGPSFPAFPPCVIPGSPVTLQDLETYQNTSNFMYTDVMVQPVKRVTLNLGYAVNQNTGNILILNPNAFPGPLNFSFHKPYAGIAIELVKGWTWKTSWGFYDYREQPYAFDLTAPRSFRGNMVSLSLRYAF